MFSYIAQKYKLDELKNYDTLYIPQVLVMTAIWVGAVSAPYNTHQPPPPSTFVNELILFSTLATLAFPSCHLVCLPREEGEGGGGEFTCM